MCRYAADASELCSCCRPWYSRGVMATARDLCQRLKHDPTNMAVATAKTALRADRAQLRVERAAEVDDIIWEHMQYKGVGSRRIRIAA